MKDHLLREDDSTGNVESMMRLAHLHDDSIGRIPLMRPSTKEAMQANSAPLIGVYRLCRSPSEVGSH